MSTTRDIFDARNFRWTLSALQRKREHDVELAAARIAGLEREQLLLQDALREAEQARRDQMAASQAQAGAIVNLSLRHHALAYFRNAQVAEAVSERELQAVGQRLVQARQCASEAQCSLEVLRKMRASGWAAHASAQARRAARESDLAWLARHAGRATAGEVASQ
jgi:hypothetical protein